MFHLFFTTMNELHKTSSNVNVLKYKMQHLVFNECQPFTVVGSQHSILNTSLLIQYLQMCTLTHTQFVREFCPTLFVLTQLTLSLDHSMPTMLYATMCIEH